MKTRIHTQFFNMNIQNLSASFSVRPFPYDWSDVFAELLAPFEDSVTCVICFCSWLFDFLLMSFVSHKVNQRCSPHRTRRPLRPKRRRCLPFSRRRCQRSNPRSIPRSSRRRCQHCSRRNSQRSSQHSNRLSSQLNSRRSIRRERKGKAN